MTAEDIDAKFGPEMRDLVIALGQDPGISDRAERRADHRHRVAVAGERALLVYLSDRLAGIEAMLERIETGDDPSELEANRRLGLWRGDVEALSGTSPPPGLVADISDRLDRLERLIS